MFPPRVCLLTHLCVYFGGVVNTQKVGVSTITTQNLLGNQAVNDPEQCRVLM